MAFRHRSTIFVVVVAATLLLLSQGAPTSNDDDRCGIRCIFKGESAELPTHTYDVPATTPGGEVEYQIKIYGGVCAHFDFVGTSKTTFLNLSNYEVHHETTQVSTPECTTFYDVLSAATGEVLSSGGSATFTLDIPSILTGMRVVPDPLDGIPAGVELTQCESTGARFILANASVDPELVKGALEAAGTAEDAACRSIRGLMGRITAKFEEWIPKIREGKEAPAPPKPYVPTPEEAEDLCNLSQSAVLNVARYAINDVIGPSGIAALMERVTNGTGHAWGNMSSDVLAGILGGYMMFVTSDVLYSFTEGDFYNLTEWDDVRSGLPAPNGDSYSFYTRAQMGALDASVKWLAENYLNNRQWEYLGLNDERGGLRIGFAEPVADVWARLHVNATRLRELTPPMLLEPGCLLGALKRFELSALTLNASAVTDWGFTFESGDFEAEFEDSLNSFAAVLAEAYAPHQIGLINGYYVTSHLMALNSVISKALGNEWPCEPLPGYVAPPVVNFLALWVMLGLTLGAWAAIVIAAEVFRSHSSSSSSSKSPEAALSPAQTPVYGVDDGTTPPPTEGTRLNNPAGTPGVSPVYSGESRRDGEEALLKERARRMPSLLMTARLSPVLRYAMPLLLFVNISMFIVSNASISASVFPTVVFGDFPVEVGSLFDFGLVNTIRDMWSAGVYPLAILIAFFSGAWPYIKLILMLASWVLPPRVLPLRPRETILRVVDALGKWSLIDSYVMTLMLVAFRYHIVFPVADPADPNGPPPSYVDVIVDARVGFVLFVLATMLSLVLGHVILAIHRANEEALADAAAAAASNASVGRDGNVNADVVTYSGEDMENEALARTKIALRSVAFKGSKEDTFMQVFIAVLLVVSVALVCYGISIQSLAYDVRGLVGWLFELMHIERRTEYSLVDMGAHVLSSSANPSSFTAILIVVIFFATAVVFPLVHLVVLIFLWLAPLTLKAQRRIFVLMEVLNAWSALDVYVVSCLAALLQLRQFALWIVGDSCDFINPFIKKYLGDVVPGDPVCFDLVAKLDSGSWVLLAACIIYDAASIIVMNKCHKALETRKGKKIVSK